MAEVLLFHHALGLTPGVTAFADDLRARGHVVHTPDLYDGRTFATVDEGVAHARELGDTLDERARELAETLPAEIVYAGFSLGVMPAQQLAQKRPGARGAVLMHAAVPLEYLGPWPDGLALQIHTMEDDELGDVAEARELAQAVTGAELFLYPGDTHLFTDRSTADYDEAAATLVKERVLRFLDERAG
jgi:dienelactone hydrolase